MLESAHAAHRREGSEGLRVFRAAGWAFFNFNSPLDYVNRVHFEEDVGKLQIIPEEYPNLPQEAEIQCLANSFRVEGKRLLQKASSRSVSPSAGDRVRRGVSEERGALRSELYG